MPNDGRPPAATFQYTAVDSLETHAGAQPEGHQRDLGQQGGPTTWKCGVACATEPPSDTRTARLRRRQGETIASNAAAILRQADTTLEEAALPLACTHLLSATRSTNDIHGGT